jgi:hypothetical protein
MNESAFRDIVEAFNSDDHDRRVELLSRHIGEDAEIAHIHGEATGPVGFAHDIGSIRQALPEGLEARLDGDPGSLHRWWRQRWTLVDGAGSLFASGVYIARLADDGNFSHLVSLPDQHP